MSTHNISFCGEIRKILMFIMVEKSALSGVMRKNICSCAYQIKMVCLCNNVHCQLLSRCYSCFALSFDAEMFT